VKARNLPLVGEAAAEYVRFRLGPTASARRLVSPAPGRRELSPAERNLAGFTDAGLRRLGVRCLGRSVVVARMLRRRGIDARLSFSVAAAQREAAHAEVAVGERPLRAHPEGNVLFR
jgi:hypothetical protein